MEIKKETIVNAYKNGDESVKKMLRTMFPDIEFETAQAAEKRPVTERIKTFADAVEELGEEHPLVRQWASFVGSSFDKGTNKDNADLYAYYKLRVITAALNGSWQPKFTDDERRWFPWFYIYTKGQLAKTYKRVQSRAFAIDDYDTDYDGIASAGSYFTHSSAIAHVVSRLCYKSEELANYSGRQFADLWADFYLIRK